MTLERSRHHAEADAGTADAAPPRSRPRPANLDQLRDRAGRHGEAARAAIARVLQGGQPQHQLDQLRNTSGQ